MLTAIRVAMSMHAPDSQIRLLDGPYDPYNPKGVAIFSAVGGSGPSLHLDGDVWTEMGRPQKITLTIEPGDRVNDA